MRREFAGAIHHVMNRGDRREEIFRDKQDRRRRISRLCRSYGAWKSFRN